MYTIIIIIYKVNYIYNNTTFIQRKLTTKLELNSLLIRINSISSLSLQ